MFSKRMTVALVGVVLVLAVAVAGVAVSQRALASPALSQDSPGAVVPPGWYWSYAVKFVCGVQASTAGAVGESIVKPGNYATDVNIHNPYYDNFEPHLYKKVVTLVDSGLNPPLAVREPQIAAPSQFVEIFLGPDFGTMDDCNAIYRMTHAAPPPGPMSLFIGYLVILSPAKYNMDVTAVYTAGQPDTAAGQAPVGVSIDVETVTPKRIYHQ
jgi:hypothetical protein